MWLAAALVLAVIPATQAPTRAAQDLTPVEQAEALARPRPGTLATGGYVPSPREQPFFSKLSPAERTTGSMLQEYSIAGKRGSYVGWFGIVRKIDEDHSAGITRLLVEHKYFDGLTDSHIMAVSFHGGGDFNVTLSGTGLGIKYLSLIKAYGVVQKEEDSMPELKAEYVRQWDWGRFTFLMAYGTQKGNAEWQS